jgi:hypothetical protein
MVGPPEAREGDPSASPGCAKEIDPTSWKEIGFGVKPPMPDEPSIRLGLQPDRTSSPWESEGYNLIRSIILDSSQAACRVGAENHAAEHKKLAWDIDVLVADATVDLQMSYRSFCRSHSGALNESTGVGVKTGGSRVGVPELWIFG